jgi:hypothetical protein
MRGTIAMVSVDCVGTHRYVGTANDHAIRTDPGLFVHYLEGS